MQYTYKVEMVDGSDVEVTAHRVIGGDGFIKFYVYEERSKVAQSRKIAMFPADRVKAVYAIDGDK
ncbi:MAG: hypothetical protein ACRCUJ_07585 [Phocaeicola sp.]